MGCGCKKKQQSSQPTVTPQAINISFAEQTSSNLTKTQENLVNQIVENLNKIGEKTENSEQNKMI